MSSPAPALGRVGYVTKMYPRYSETFIVHEILAHEAAGLPLDIFSLRTPSDPYFQDIVARVRSPVTQIPSHSPSTQTFWTTLSQAGSVLPDLWPQLHLASQEGTGALDIYQAVLVAVAARQRSITHLHAHFASVGTSIARLAARFAGLTYSFTAHAKDIYHDSVKTADLLRKIRDAHQVITVSDYNLRHLRELAGPDAGHIQRVYNGLDHQRLTYQAPETRSPLILGVGRLVEKKGFTDLIDACALLARRGVPFECRIVGRGELEPVLRAQIAALGLGDQVHLLGALPQAEVLRLIAQAAAFALPCVVGADGNRDGLPTVLLEAMALGTPCISTPVTGIPEVVRDRDTGLLVPEHCPEALSQALQELLRDASLRVRLAGQARALVSDEFDIHRNAARIRQAFQPAAAGVL
ncbi:colanic acid biosynthesis glycosyltransferase WcaL [Deinococcus malanensis]|uniref:Colanic acid biosynthesis glycosyltransferase WcaL n=1 Tax=Deinococcus malanensis TaxID=1706855 RepID=A0ABQ2EM96_9DEIO|nr:glycosyltransferase [Deinococcus malanensis]GGK17091.1 colanic acid biosynthesis glycosyltransferase WcaL [Deinococcus malanensis]